MSYYKKVKAAKETKELMFDAPPLAYPVKFDYNGKELQVNRYKGDNDEEPRFAIYNRNGFFADGMNVNDIGGTSFTVYTFDILGNQTRGRLKFEDITIVND